MKKYLCLLIAIFVITTNLSAEIIKEHWTPKNSILKSDNVYTMFKDSKERIWIFDFEGLYLKENGVWTVKSDTLKKYLSTADGAPGFYAFNIYEDSHGNIIFDAGAFGIAIYKTNNQWQLFSAKDYNILQHNKGIVFDNNRMYVLCPVVLFTYLKYDSNSNEYKVDKADYMSFIPDSIYYVRAFQLYQGKLYGFGDGQIPIYDIATKQWSSYKKPILEKMNILDSGRSPIMLMNDKGVITNAFSDVKTLVIYRIYNPDSIKVFIYPYPSTTKEDYANIYKIIYLDKNKEEILMTFEGKLIYFSDKTGFKSIPFPPNVNENDWISIRKLYLMNENELWLSTVMNGIYIMDLKELLATGVPVPTSSVEINPYLPMMDIYSIYPQPNANFVNFEYYLQSGLFSDLKVSLFDSFGTRIENINYENTNKESVISTIRLNTTSLSAGVYILQIDNGGNKATAKFIVEK